MIFRLSDAPPTPGLLEWVRSRVLLTDAVLDVGCGDKRYEDIPCSEMVSIDAWPKACPDILIDLELCSLPFNPNSFDVVLMLDFLEHLKRKSGEEILRQAQIITRKSVLVMTPLPEHWNENRAPFEEDGWWKGNSYALHRSVWSPDDFVSGWARSLLVGFEAYFLGEWRKESR